MHKSQSSLTAEGIAYVRAYESAKPEGERVCYDPYARQFVRPVLFAMMQLFLGFKMRQAPGVVEFLAARTRFIDDVLSAQLADGLPQLVILGAGFDARAYRFPGLMTGVKVFEVDHPATQRLKLAKVRRIFGEQPRHVTYVAVDFETQSLDERLKSAGYDPSLKTFFIWEGVTEYLRPESIDATLAFVRTCAGPGSTVVFDYIYAEAFSAEKTPAEMASMRRNQFWTGEGLVFGIPKGQAAAFLAERGFDCLQDAAPEDLKQAYFTGPNRQGRPVAPIYALAYARVSPS